MENQIFNKQSFYSKLNFVNIDDDDKKLNISIVLTTNHNLDEKLIQSIEQFINKLLINDYEKLELYALRRKEEAETMKKEKLAKLEYEKQEKERLKKLNNELKQQKKKQLELKKLNELKIKNDLKTINKYK